MSSSISYINIFCVFSEKYHIFVLPIRVDFLTLVCYTYTRLCSLKTFVLFRFFIFFQGKALGSLVILFDFFSFYFAS